MVEVSLAILTTTISTIVVVTMTTIFFCCWRKKGSGDIVAGKTSKSSPTKEEFRKERSTSPIHVAVERPENGVVTENQSSQTFVESNEDLGDFSAVQRETEILRSYRKPPPPKNRARQSRAPRLNNSGTESLDIFTELSEEDGKNEESSDKENIGSYDDASNALLRPRSESKEKTPREARSSMLADIEQTLAALHTSDQNTTAPLGKGVLSEEITLHPESISKVTIDIHDENSVKETNYEPHRSDLIMSEDKSSHSHGLISPEPISLNVTGSPKVNHTAKPRPGPKVSPKPSPRVSARVSSGDDNLSVSPTIDKDTHVNHYSSLSSLADNADSADTAISSLQCPSSQTVAETTNMEISEETTVSDLRTTLKSLVGESSASNIKSPTAPLDNTGSDVLSIPTDTIVMVREEIKSEGAFKSFNDKSETAGFSNTTVTSEYPLTDIGNEDTLAELSGSITTKSITEAEAASSVEFENQTLVAKSKETDPLSDEALHSDIIGSMHESPTKEIKIIETEEATGQDSPVKETVAVQVQLESSHGARSKENGNELEELNEDQTGKGKTSKIPVRSGSKPRSSPP